MEQQIQSVDLAHSMQITVQSYENEIQGFPGTSSVTFQFHLQGLSKGK